MALELALEAVGDGAPVVVLHGLFGSSGNWRGVARKLAMTHRVISADLRNHGASPWADTMEYVEMADDVRRLIERECREPPMVIGHSMGGKIAMALALLHPEQVERLVVVDIAPLSYTDTLTPFSEAMRNVDVIAAVNRADVQRCLAQAVPDAAVLPFLMQNLVQRNDHFDWRLNLVAISASMRGLCGFPFELTGRRYDGPLRVIAGGRSGYVPRDASPFRPMFPRARLDSIEQAGHWVHADAPDEFVAAVRRAMPCAGAADAAANA
jgi:pimeloyl-ACP methyl ester carboxylesterase